VPPDKEELKKWQDRIRAGEEFRKTKAFESKWPIWRNWLRGIFAEGTMPNNMIYGLYKSFIPRVYFRTPRVVVVPTRPQAYYQALIVETLDNWILREIKIKKQVKRIIGDAFWFGLGGGKVGFDSEFGYFPTETELSEGSLPGETWRNKAGNLIEYNADVKPGMPWFLRVKPCNVAFPWGAENTESVPWAADMVVRGLEDVKEDPKYDNKAELEANFKVDAKDPKLSQYKEEFVKLWEIRDLKSGMMMVISLDHDKFLLKEKDRLQTEGLSYTFLGFNEDLDQIWPVSDAQVLEPKQRELNEIDTQLMKHRRICLVKFLFDMNLIDEDEVDKLVGEEVGAGIKCKGKPADGVMEFHSTIPAELIDLKRIGREDMRELIGFSRVEMGEFQGKTHVTKEEVQRVGRGSEIRMSERGDIVADLLKDAIAKINQIVFTVWKKPRFVQVIGPDLMRYWVEYTGEDLRGEYNYDAEPIEEVPQDPREREEKAAARFQMLYPLSITQVDPNTGQPAGEPLIDQVELVRQYLEASGPGAERLFRRAPEKIGFKDMMNKFGGMERR